MTKKNKIIHNYQKNIGLVNVVKLTKSKVWKEKGNLRIQM